MLRLLSFSFNDTATTEIYTLSLHDALPISGHRSGRPARPQRSSVRIAPQTQRRGEPDADPQGCQPDRRGAAGGDRKSTRLNSSHLGISYAVFCLKKKKKEKNKYTTQTNREQ